MKAVKEKHQTLEETGETRQDFKRDPGARFVKELAEDVKREADKNIREYGHPWLDQKFQFKEDLLSTRIKLGEFKRAQRDPLAPNEVVWFDYDEIDRRLAGAEAETKRTMYDAFRQVFAWMVRGDISAKDAEKRIFERAQAVAKHFNLDLGVKHQKPEETQPDERMKSDKEQNENKKPDDKEAALINVIESQDTVAAHSQSRIKALQSENESLRRIIVEAGRLLIANDREKEAAEIQRRESANQEFIQQLKGAK
jgi:hypothetical protein